MAPVKKTVLLSVMSHTDPDHTINPEKEKESPMGNHHF